jgi:hypothetical protein
MINIPLLILLPPGLDYPELRLSPIITLVYGKLCKMPCVRESEREINHAASKYKNCPGAMQ